ncbi:hypothetical protein BGZ80_005495 [Entomortierella chlamydospora]|uniref:Uncharacterized protein n=1 Tax=Entomortierella chlamydospora TaxID=101097 RepID=A0A9P6MJJ8_9FUNG|nr:hypothetical protein BGZ80_005495 [Entomortierella chlamydospora]
MLSTVSLIDPTTLNPSFSGPENSRMGRPAVIITRADQQTSVDQVQLLLTNAKAYRLQMLALSKAAANFGYALEKIAHSKAAVRDSSNSDTLYKQFEIPLLQHLDTHKANIETTESQYERSMREMSQKIKETEATSLQNGRKRQRDLFQFRQALTTLTMQVDELERIKLGYYFSNLESEQANLQLILQKTSTIVRAEVDIYERIANKGLNDAVLEPMTTQGPDPYCTYPTTDEFSPIFSILPATPIIPTSGSGATGTHTPQPDSIMSDFYGYHESNPFSTARNMNNVSARDRHLFGDASSIESREPVIKQTANVTNGPQTTVETVKATKDTPSLTNGSDKEAISDDAHTTKMTKDSENTTTSAEKVDQVDSSQKNGDKDVTELGVKGPEENESSTQQETKKHTQCEVADDAQSPVDTCAVEEGQEGEATNGMDLRTGQQHHRHQAAPSKDQEASSPSEPASSVRSYPLRSRSGSRSNRLSSTPDSPPVRGAVHIPQDSELLNNRDFSFSYEPSELLVRSRHSTHNALQTFAGFGEIEEEGGFGATPPTTQQQINGTLPQIGRSQLHGLRHHSSDSHLSHSSSIRSSIGSFNSLHHRRSTGKMKTDFESSAAMFDSSLDEPFLPSMKHHPGFDDGMPAFFADEVEDDQGLHHTPPRSIRYGSTNGSRRHSGSEELERTFAEVTTSLSVESVIRMADGSSRNVSSTNLNEITA